MFKQMKTKEDFEIVYPILEEAFPITELRIKENQCALLEDPLYHLYAILDMEEVVCGVLAAWELAEDFIYIEHFAIIPEKRNGGFGGHVLEQFAEQTGKQIVLEVELPEDTLTKRRIAFYERHGFCFNNYAYLQPPMRKGQDMLPLRLMTKPKPIDTHTYERYKTLIHRYVYHYIDECAVRR